jgi:hypothetical protein
VPILNSRKRALYSEEERKERESLRLREQFNLGEPPTRVPLLKEAASRPHEEIFEWV